MNAYGSINGRLELNTHFNTTLNEKWSTGMYIHADRRGEKFDNNNDSFLDVPLAKQINVMNRWQYTNLEKGLISFLNFRFWMIKNNQDNWPMTLKSISLEIPFGGVKWTPNDLIFQENSAMSIPKFRTKV